MYHLSENVRELTLAFQEDASFFDSSMATLIRSLDSTLKTLPAAAVSSSFDYGGGKSHFMIAAAPGASRNQPGGGSSSSFAKKTMISTIEGRDS